MSILEAPRINNGEEEPIFQPRYEMSEEEMSALTAKLLHEHNATLPPGMPFVCFRIKSTSPYTNIARKIEADIFVNDLNENRDIIEKDWAPYEDHSYFFLVVDVEQNRAAGALRIIDNGPQGFMTLNDIAEPPYGISASRFYEDYNASPIYTWDVGTIAVIPEYRRGVNASQEQKLSSYIVSGLLYRSLYAGARANNIDSFVSLIDPKALGTLRNLGIPFVDIYDLPSKNYEDGTTYQPVFADVRNFEIAMRSFAQIQVDNAQSDKDRHRAINLQLMIDELLTGNALDGMMTFRHNNVSTNSVI